MCIKQETSLRACAIPLPSSTNIRCRRSTGSTSSHCTPALYAGPYEVEVKYRIYTVSAMQSTTLISPTKSCANHKVNQGKSFIHVGQLYPSSASPASQSIEYVASLSHAPTQSPQARKGTTSNCRCTQQQRGRVVRVVWKIPFCEDPPLAWTAQHSMYVSQAPTA